MRLLIKLRLVRTTGKAFLKGRTLKSRALKRHGFPSTD